MYYEIDHEPSTVSLLLFTSQNAPPQTGFAFDTVSLNKAVPLQAWSGPEGSRKLRFPDFMTTAQNVLRLSALRTAAFTPRKYSWYSFLLEAESNPGP